LIDCLDASGLQNIAFNIYKPGGGIISVVCYVDAIFYAILDKSTGRTIIDGKKVAGFTTQGEEEEGVLDTIISWIRPAIEEAAKSAGANCEYCG